MEVSYPYNESQCTHCNLANLQCWDRLTLLATSALLAYTLLKLCARFRLSYGLSFVRQGAKESVDMARLLSVRPKEEHHTGRSPSHQGTEL
jgi:hypothetical protein